MDILGRPKRRRGLEIRKVCESHDRSHDCMPGHVTVCYAVAPHLKMTSVTLWAEIKEEMDWYYRYVLN